MVKLFLVSFFFRLIFASQALFFPFNSSSLSSISVVNTYPSVPSSAASGSFLKDILSAVSEKEGWNSEAEARVSAVDAESARIGAIQSYEFHLRVGGTALVLKFSEEADEWRKTVKGEVEFGPDLVVRAAEEVFREGVRALMLEGPLELHASGPSDELSVHLPLSITHQGIRRVFVGEGIKIQLDGAHEVSIFYPSGTNLLINANSTLRKNTPNTYWKLGFPSCAPLLSVRVIGRISLAAYRTRDSTASIETSFPSPGNIHLLPERCYPNGLYEQTHLAAASTLSSKLVVIERLLTSFLGKSILRRGSTRFIRTKVTSSTLLKLRVEVERNIGESDKNSEKVAGWRTRQTVERAWFEIVARFEEERGLRPVIARKLSRPLMTVESAAWSHLMSNISFTEFHSIVVPPEALTLDVKW
ncbi:hypothetical protein AXF42_Ash010328 [Apostasia shenzhenica]|uniref:Uncharacterized protein n=1 Tax=Apostasia shenzhenica TaxID=1088818 RepID=A0A2I0BDN7_9ASPA|nr:hypothetical protein AXF42_Ash010328 [Apostasia shenzhenica]